MKTTILLSVWLFLPRLASAQFDNCILPDATFTQYVNENLMVVTNGGDNYANKDIIFTPTTYFPYSYRPSLFSTNIWLFGLNKKKEVVGMGSTYRNTKQWGVSPGFINVDGEVSLNKEFNQIWTASRFDIEQHIADFSDNKKIDKPQKSIFSWPARGNAFFETYNNFNLPNQELAPFFDANLNGNYEPDQGEFPLPDNVSIQSIPDIITWTIYCGQSKCQDKLNTPFVEVHQTTWAFNCTTINVLNHTNFVSYKIFNKGVETVDSTFFGLWSDPDIGCYFDDNIGCSPSQNAYFAYNQKDEDATDSPCLTPLTIWQKELMPVVSATLLNKPMDAFYYMQKSIFFSEASVTDNPTVPIEYYGYLNGYWKNAVPFSDKGYGYANNNTPPPPKYMFSGNPNDPSQNSIRTIGNLYRKELYPLAVTKIGKFAPNQIFKIDVAYTMHRKVGNTVSQNIDLMYKGIDSVQNLYNNHFVNNCNKKAYCVHDDCVYPGEVNKDGIVDYKDLVDMAIAISDTGTTRTAPLVFAPFEVKNWENNFNNGTNVKHADTNGDGKINTGDIGIINLFYGATTPTYQKQQNIFPSSSEELQLTLDKVLDYTTLTLGKKYRLDIKMALNNTQAIGFQLEIDTSLMEIKPYPFSTFKNCVLNINREGTQNIVSFAKTSPSATTALIDTIGGSFEVFGKIAKSDTISKCTKILFRNVVACTTTGKKVRIGAKNLDLCFVNFTSNVGEVNEKYLLEVYPSPFSNILNVENNTLFSANIKIINVLGHCVDYFVSYPTTKIRVETNHLANGVYFLKCSNDKCHWTQKIIKYN